MQQRGQGADQTQILRSVDVTNDVFILSATSSAVNSGRRVVAALFDIAKQRYCV